MTYKETNDYKEAMKNLKDYGYQMEIDALEKRKKAYTSIFLTIAFVIVLVLCFKIMRDVTIIAPAFIGSMWGLKKAIAGFDKQIETGRELQSETLLNKMSRQEVISKWNQIALEAAGK